VTGPELTVAGGRIVYASDRYAGQAEPLPEISVDWSPVARFGGYQNVPSGVRLNRPGSDGDPHDGIPTGSWSVRWAA
jgi:hypothetical protein